MNYLISDIVIFPCVNFSIQDNVQTFEEFVAEKNKAYDETMSAQSDNFDKLRDNVEAMDKSCASLVEQHNGELETIRHSIVEVKDDFQRFMVGSQMHMLELQEKSNVKMEQMQDNMAKEMGNTKEKLDRMKASIDSIEYIINDKLCGRMGRFFAFC